MLLSVSQNPGQHPGEQLGFGNFSQQQLFSAYELLTMAGIKVWCEC